MKKTLKKITALMLTLILFVCAMVVGVVPANAAIYNTDSFRCAVVKNETTQKYEATLLDYQGGTSNLVVPSTVIVNINNKDEECVVTTIGYDCFKENGSNLKSVALPSTLTELGYGAFHKCESLETINIPEGVKSIGKFAFNGCISLKNITIPNKVESIGDFAFSECPALESISIPSSVKKMGYALFSDDTSLKKVTLSSAMGQLMFYGCTSLSVVDLGSVPEIEYMSFKDCASLNTIYYNGKQPTLEFEALKNSPAKLVKKLTGDINSDEKLNIMDATEYQLILASKKAATEAFEINGDIVGNGKKDINDVTYLQLYLCNKIKSL